MVCGGKEDMGKEIACDIKEWRLKDPISGCVYRHNLVP